jgi:hypothetical protein
MTRADEILMSSTNYGRKYLARFCESGDLGLHDGGRDFVLGINSIERGECWLCRRG